MAPGWFGLEVKLIFMASSDFVLLIYGPNNNFVVAISSVNKGLDMQAGKERDFWLIGEKAP